MTFTQFNIAIKLARKFGRKVVAFNDTGNSDEVEMVYVNGHAPDTSRKTYRLDEQGKLRAVDNDTVEGDDDATGNAAAN